MFTSTIRSHRSRMHSSSSNRSSTDADVAPSLPPAAPAAPAAPTTLRTWLWSTLNDPQSSATARYVGMVMSLVIAVSTVAFILETEKSVVAVLGEVFSGIEVVSIAVFTLDVGLRLLVCPSKRAFVRDPFNWVDVVAVLPYYIGFLVPAGATSFSVVRVVRLVRVFRVFKVSRYSSTLRVFSKAMSLSALPLFTMLFLVSIAMILFSSAMYYAESTVDDCAGVWEDVHRAHAACTAANGYSQHAASSTFTYAPGPAAGGSAAASVTCTCSKPNPFTSIPSSCWWCVVTMATVGYGDVVPMTSAGKVIAGLTMLAGIIILALPITVIGSKFSEVMLSEEDRVAKELQDAGRALSLRERQGSAANKVHPFEEPHLLGTGASALFSPQLPRLPIAATRYNLDLQASLATYSSGSLSTGSNDQPASAPVLCTSAANTTSSGRATGSSGSGGCAVTGAPIGTAAAAEEDGPSAGAGSLRHAGEWLQDPATDPVAALSARFSAMEIRMDNRLDDIIRSLQQLHLRFVGSEKGED